MANKKVSEEYLQQVMKRVGAMKMQNGKKQMLQAGKELVLLCLWVEAVGAKPSTDVPTFLAELFMDYPDELKQILAFYESIKERPSITKGLIQSFSIKIISGELYAHFTWQKMGDEKLADIVRKMKVLGMEAL